MGAKARRGRDGAMGTTVDLDGRHLGLEQIEAIAVGGAPVTVTAEARERVKAARACVEPQFEAGATSYGRTTGLRRAPRRSTAPASNRSNSARRKVSRSSTAPK